MRKTLFVLAMILLLMLTACSTKETLPTDSDSEDTILILAPTESESDTDPTESVKETVGRGETESSSQTEESQPQKSEDKNSETTVQDTTKPPVVSKEQENISQTDDTSESESSTPPTETTHPPATESTAPEKEPPETDTETVTPTVERPSNSEVASLVAVYVNQYRSSPATVLPGLSNVASYRANQLVTKFAHSDGIDACNALQYGEFVDMTLYGMSESDSYYQGYNREAIAKGNWGGTADEIAQRIATGFKNSSSHWSYLGSNEYCYIAVGCTYDEASSMWYCCICVSSKNYGG